MSEKNGIISKSLLGFVFTLIIGCTLAWVNWVYGNVGELHSVGKTNAQNIAALQECSKSLTTGQERIEKKIDRLLEMHLR